MSSKNLLQLQKGISHNSPPACSRSARFHLIEMRHIWVAGEYLIDFVLSFIRNNFSSLSYGKLVSNSLGARLIVGIL